VPVAHYRLRSEAYCSCIVGATVCLLALLFIYRASDATYMPHSLQKHVYESNTHKIRRKLKTKYIDNKNKIKNNDQYLVCGSSCPLVRAMDGRNALQCHADQLPLPIL